MSRKRLLIIGLGYCLSASLAQADMAPFGWSCTGVEDPEAVQVMNLQASVMRMEPSREAPGEYFYQLRVSAIAGEPGGTILYPLLRLHGVRSREDVEGIVFEGENGVAKAQLSVRPVWGELRAPGVLRLNRSTRLPEDPLPANTETDMICTAIR